MAHEARVMQDTYLKNKDKLATQKGTNCPEADKYIRPEYREGWKLEG